MSKPHRCIGVRCEGESSWGADTRLMDDCTESLGPFESPTTCPYKQGCSVLPVLHGSRPDRFQNEISPTSELEREPIRSGGTRTEQPCPLKIVQPVGTCGQAGMHVLVSQAIIRLSTCPPPCPPLRIFFSKRRLYDFRGAITTTLIASILLLATAAAVTAQGVGTTLDRYTVDSGGGLSGGSGYALSGTVGQPEAGSTVQGGGYVLTSGFWVGDDSSSTPTRPGNPDNPGTPGNGAGKTILLPLIMNE